MAGVGIAELMSVDAAVLAPVSAPDVLGMSDWFKMGGVDARTVAAQMI